MRNLKSIAHIKTQFSDKFGIPRQSGMVKGVTAKIIFEPQYRNADAVRGLDGFSHIWLLWEFSESVRETWSPTVRPPRLGGNKRMGVFATRSPFRPNPIGLSSVRLEKIEITAEHGPIIWVSGADILDDTPIYDIKPYLPFTDSHTDAKAGFTTEYEGYSLNVNIDEGIKNKIPQDILDTVVELLAADPRPSYQSDANRVYGMKFGGYEVKFTVDESELYVVSFEKT